VRQKEEINRYSLTAKIFEWQESERQGNENDFHKCREVSLIQWISALLGME